MSGLSDHLILADRQTGKTTYLISRMVEDIRNGDDAVYVAMTKQTLDFARVVLDSFWVWPEQRKGKVDPEQHLFGWGRWRHPRWQRRGAHVYVDDGHVLFGQAMRDAADDHLVVAFGVTWPVKALITPKLGAEWPALGEVKP